MKNLRKERKAGRADFEDFVSDASSWYEARGRSFPWRTSTDLYRIAVAEILLQKTPALRAERVYQHLISQYPDAESMAEANLSNVEALIRPLGFSFRARTLMRMSRKILEVPESSLSFEDLVSVKGIGEYSASMILVSTGRCYVPAVDVNIARVVSRVLGMNLDPKKVDCIRQVRKEVSTNSELFGEREVIYAVLDIGALFCRPRMNKCDECPLKACKSRHAC
jgi:A/G-specific adenine glycosylase